MQGSNEVGKNNRSQSACVTYLTANSRENFEIIFNSVNFMLYTEKNRLNIPKENVIQLHISVFHLLLSNVNIFFTVILV